MSVRDDRAPVWAIWLLIAFGAIQPILWSMPGTITRRPLVIVPFLLVWITLLVLAGLATRRMTWLWRALTQQERAHRVTLNEVEQLQTQNAMLETIARSVDVPLAFQELAHRMQRLVPCDRVGLALLSEDGQEFHTYTARVDEGERRPRSRPEVMFKVERTIIGNVVRSREPFITGDMQDAAADHLDANVVATAGFRSALVIPLISTDRAVGTLSVVSRRKHAFERSHIAPLLPIAEILAVAWVAQQLQLTIARHRTLEAISDMTLSISTEINSALQTIVGHCDLLTRTYQDPGLQSDLATVITQAQRISALLEKMRTAARQRLEETTGSMQPSGGRADASGPGGAR